MDKNNIKEILLTMKNPDNELDEVSEEELHIRFNQLNISESNIQEYLKALIEKAKSQTESSDKFIPVNEWFCYGRTKNTIHLHLIPKDLRGIKNELGDESFYALYKEQLEDFLAKMQTIFLEDPSIKSLFAVSPIFYNPNITLIHESLGFDKLIEIDLNNNSDNMSVEQKEHFINMFNKGGNIRKVYYTKISREKFLEM